MAASPSVKSYPWDTLEPFSRQTVHAIQAVRHALAEPWSSDRLERGLEQVVGGSVRLSFGRYLEPSSVDESPGALHFESSDGRFSVSVTAEPQLADVLLSKLLGQKAGLARGDATTNPALKGALSRIVVEAWRTTGPSAALVVSAERRASNAYAALGVGGTLVYDDKPYEVRASVRALGALEPSEPAASLRALGELKLSVPLCAVECLAARRDLSSLALGDAFVPSQPWGWTPRGGGRLAILGEAGRGGAFFEPLDARSAKLCPSGVQVQKGETLMAEDDDLTLPGTAMDAVLDAPVVVHVEVASVTLSGRAWSELRPGDVVRTDRRVGEQATLRIAGRAAATGELVNVEGELGVRIRRLIEGDSDET